MRLDTAIKITEQLVIRYEARQMHAFDIKEENRIEKINKALRKVVDAAKSVESFLERMKK